MKHVILTLAFFAAASSANAGDTKVSRKIAGDGVSVCGPVTVMEQRESQSASVTIDSPEHVPQYYYYSVSNDNKGTIFQALLASLISHKNICVYTGSGSASASSPGVISGYLFGSQ